MTKVKIYKIQDLQDEIRTLNKRVYFLERQNKQYELKLMKAEQTIQDKNRHLKKALEAGG